MFFASLVLVIILSLGLLFLLADAKSDYAALRHVTEFRNVSKAKPDLLSAALDEKFSVLTSIVGKGALAKLLLPIIILSLLCMGFLGPYLTNQSLGLILGAVMAIAYVSRIFFHIAAHFRNKLLTQLERILLSIRNNLSTGMTLDYAVSESVKYNEEEPLGSHLTSFIKLSEANFVEKFPLWMNSVQKQFRLRELAKSAQLLSLELIHTNNQEEAFMNAAASVANRQKQNKQQRNTLYITFFTLDFMTLGFFGLLFWVIPGFSEEWWFSGERVFAVFAAAMIIWGAYALTIIIALWRQS